MYALFHHGSLRTLCGNKCKSIKITEDNYYEMDRLK